MTTTTMPTCDYCPAAAPITITSRAGASYRCYAHEYGPTEPRQDVIFSQGERGAWRRHEADGHVTHVASGTDRTPVHFQYPRGYDSRCGWCYLNATHSEQAHRQEVGA